MGCGLGSFHLGMRVQRWNLAEAFLGWTMGPDGGRDSGVDGSRFTLGGRVVRFYGKWIPESTR